MISVRNMLMRVFPAAALAALPAVSATVTLLPAGSQCEYASAEVTSAGAMTFHCQTGPAPPIDPIPPTPIPPIPPTGCNPGAIQSPLLWGEVRQLRLGTDQVVAFPIALSQLGRASVVFTQGQQPQSGSHPNTTYSVSQCPGVLGKEVSTQCAYGSGNISNNNITVFNTNLPQFGWYDQSTIPGCYAPTADGVWYLNLRWQWAPGGCPSGNGTCGFSLQWSEGAW